LRKLSGDTTLGAGQFGIVMKGNVKNIHDCVAIKTIRPNTSVSYCKALLSELKILQYIGSHPHIVNLIGACTENIRNSNNIESNQHCDNMFIISMKIIGHEFF